MGFFPSDSCLLLIKCVCKAESHEIDLNVQERPESSRLYSQHSTASTTSYSFDCVEIEIRSFIVEENFQLLRKS